jgi:hypothetical protein
LDLPIRLRRAAAFRLQVASVARQRTGSLDDPKPLVGPVYQNECEYCPWHDVCLPELEGDPSLPLPTADLEIDLASEWDPGGRVRLCGFLVSTPDTEPAYDPVVAWEP